MSNHSAKDFDDHVIMTIRECRRLGYNPTAFQGMLNEHGALEAAKRLAQPPAAHFSDGFVRLYDLRRLDLTIEFAIAFDDRFADLFTDAERAVARERLALYDFTMPSS